MLPSFLLALREGFEIALIVGIVFGALHQFKRQDLFRSLNLGILTAILASLTVAVVLTLMGASLEGPAEPIFEGVMMLTAAGVLTWMILWMQSHARHIKQMLQDEIGVASRAGGTAIFLVAFVAVVREGIELALLMTASVFNSGLSETVLGAIGGLILASVLGWGLYRATIKLNLRRFFQVTSILLVLFAAGLVAHGVHEFNEVNIVPSVVDHVWDTNAVLDENSVAGQVMKTLFGYNGNPSLTEVIGYVTYFVVLFAATRPRRQAAVAEGQPAG